VVRKGDKAAEKTQKLPGKGEGPIKRSGEKGPSVKRKRTQAEEKIRNRSLEGNSALGGSSPSGSREGKGGQKGMRQSSKKGEGRRKRVRDSRGHEDQKRERREEAAPRGPKK